MRIQGRAYELGERLPAERELALELGVARSTLRQALGVLMDEGYLVRRLGVKGGWFVTDLARPVAEWTEASRADLRRVRDIIDFRIAVETRAAELAAGRRSAEQLTRMAATIDDLDVMLASDAQECVDQDMADRLRGFDDHFHRLITEAADSPLVEEAVQRARAELFAVETRSAYREIGSRLPQDHRQVFDAIAAGDPDAARRAMEEHIRHGADVWLAAESRGAQAAPDEA